MTTTTQRTLDDRSRGVARQIAGLSRNPQEWDPSDLCIFHYLETVLRKAQTEVILGMREHGWTDTQIAQALGITQQAVSKRWPGGGRYVGARARHRDPAAA